MPCLFLNCRHFAPIIHQPETGFTLDRCIVSLCELRLVICSVALGNVDFAISWLSMYFIRIEETIDLEEFGLPAFTPADSTALGVCTGSRWMFHKPIERGQVPCDVQSFMNCIISTQHFRESTSIGWCVCHDCLYIRDPFIRTNYLDHYLNNGVVK